DTSQVTNMSYMFSDMSNLTTLDLSNFDTSKVTNMKGMFLAMSNLITLDLSNFNTSQVTDMSFMFFLRDHNKLKDKLEKIYVNNDFDTANLTNISQMFGNRKKLRGGNGSYLLDPLTADKSWLRIDRPGVQGYFTRKS
ncbi:MAG: BspA family leucine-rich repeat surface protein, partial [Candidatus Nanosynbacter sp.]|nr:BspA family leucine-rich repeat surface protein [Candidatus Nanosynbacter sp.]